MSNPPEIGPFDGLPEEVEALLAMNPAVLYTCKPSGDYAATYISPAVRRQLGYAPEDFLNDPGFWAAHIHPEDAPRVFAALPALFEHGTHTHEYRFRHADGGYRWMRDEVSVVADAAGTPVQLAGYWIDITARVEAEQALKESEERLRQVTDNIGAIFYMVSAEGNEVHYLSAAYEQIWGRSRESLLENPRSFLDAVHPDDKERLKKALDRQADGHYEEIFRIIRPDGTMRWIRDRAFPVTNDQGEVYRITGVATDITERRRAEEERHRYLSELAHVTRLSTMGEMASGLAHEINQPLGAIANFAQGSIERLKQRAQADPDMMESLEQISRQATRAGELVRHMRDLVKKGVSECSQVDVNQLVQDAVQLILPEASAQQVRVIQHLEDPLPGVWVDRIQVDQVLINLVRNALESMGDEGTRTVTVTTQAKGDGQVMVTVADTGVGAAPDVVGQVFDPFFTTKKSGLGMGLTICRSIVEYHGGEITMEPGPDGGATFRFTLPVYQPDEDADKDA